MEPLCAGTARSHVCRQERELQTVSGSRRTHADDERTREVGQLHSTYEAMPRDRQRKRWREGGWPRGTRPSVTRSGLRAGKTRSARSSGWRLLTELRERFAKFGLELHADKARIVEFGRFAEQNRRQRGEGKPETFNFLGFTHICGRARKGHFTVLRQTMRQRQQAKLRALKEELRRRMHTPIGEQGNHWTRKPLQTYPVFWDCRPQPRRFYQVPVFFDHLRFSTEILPESLKRCAFARLAGTNSSELPLYLELRAPAT
jgi:hypothetical protein